ncbi:MAG: hypothetical protein HRT56_03620, partial [Coraliomargarita sp.]|nr:hypothetical protein [Coraliomargarita sp.]
GRWTVVDASAIKTSEDAGYGKGSDETLQPRDRTRTASSDQVEEIARNLDPERIAESQTTDQGAPFVNDEGMVLSGNGRSLAIRKAYEEDGAKAKEYKKWLIDNADRFGLDEANLRASTDIPMLVRVVEDYGGMTQGRFAEVSNQSQLLGMSVSERAANDARAIINNPSLQELFNPSDSDILSASNREFVHRFLDEMGGKAEYINKKGEFTGDLRVRLKRALIAVAVGPDQTALIDKLTEDNEGLTRVANALSAVAPKLVKFQGTEFDLTEDLSNALSAYIEAHSSGMTVEQFQSQQSLFEANERTADADRILTVLGKHGKRSAAKVEAFFRDYIDQASRVDTTSQGLALGIDETTKDTILSNLEEQDGQQDEQLELGKAEADAQGQPETLPAEDAQVENLGGRNAELSKDSLPLRDPNDIDSIDRSIEDLRSVYVVENNAYLEHWAYIGDAQQALDSGADIKEVNRKYDSFGDYIAALKAKQMEHYDKAQKAEEEINRLLVERDNAKINSGKADIIDEIKADTMENGSTSRGGDYWIKRIQGINTDELESLLNWLSTGDASSWVTRFIGEKAHDEMAVRTGQAEAEEVAAASHPKVGRQWQDRYNRLHWIESYNPETKEFEVQMDGGRLVYMSEEELDARIAKDLHERTPEFEAEQERLIEESIQAKTDEAKKKQDRKEALAGLVEYSKATGKDLSKLTEELLLPHGDDATVTIFVLDVLDKKFGYVMDYREG